MIKSLFEHINSTYLQYLISKQNKFVDCLAKFSTKIECTNRNYFLAKKEGKIRLLNLKKDNSALSSTINNILYVSKAKTNLLSLDQLNKQGINMKTTGVRIYLYLKKKIVMKNSKIGHI